MIHGYGEVIFMHECCAYCDKVIKIEVTPGVYEWHCREEYLNIDEAYYDRCEHFTHGEED